MAKIVEIDFVPNKGEPKCHTLDVIPYCLNLAYSEFFVKFIVSNIPCLVKNVTEDWVCSTKWVKNGKPNLNYLKSTYKDSIVSVSNCSLTAESNGCKQTIPFNEYLSKYYKNQGDDVWYLKDWHLKKERPKDYLYIVPEYFASDWLNEYAVDNDLDDFMFVYMGPNGSWTQFHADVYSSFSWSANVVGKKKWLLFPPGEEIKFLDNFGNYPQDITSHIDDDVKYYEIIQNQGDALFVPSGWYHQVYNEEDTISINHNWVNGANIDFMWNALSENLLKVEEEIKEFKESKDWADHCQTMLKALFGLNYKDFYDFVVYLTKKRLSYFDKGTQNTFQNWRFGENHILFDLTAINYLLEKMTSDLHYSENEIKVMNVLKIKINNVVS